MPRDFSGAGAAVEDDLGMLRVKVATRYNDILQWRCFLHFLGERRRDSRFLVLYLPTLAWQTQKGNEIVEILQTTCHWSYPINT